MRTTTATCDRYVVVSGGLAVPVAPLKLALDLESRGIRCSRKGDDLIVEPASQLTDEDCAALRRWKHHMFAIIEYEAPEVA